MDENDDIRRGKISKALEEISIVEAVIKFYKYKSPSATCATNKTCKVIDSIWTSPGIHILCCWFFPFHDLLDFVSNQRFIWANMHNHSLYGHRLQKIFRVLASKVKQNDPEIRETYAEQVLTNYEKGVLFSGLRLFIISVFWNVKE